MAEVWEMRGIRIAANNGRWAVIWHGDFRITRDMREAVGLFVEKVQR